MSFTPLAGLLKASNKRRLDQAVTTLEQVSDLLEAWTHEDAAEPRSGTKCVRSLETLRSTEIAQIAHHKELNTAITKLGKMTDRLSGVALRSPLGLTFEASLADDALRQHLLVSGRFGCAAAIEGGPGDSSELEHDLHEMHDVRVALLAGDVAPLVAWIGSNQARLGPKASMLTFETLQIEFAQRLASGGLTDALLLLRRRRSAAAAATTTATAQAATSGPVTTTAEVLTDRRRLPQGRREVMYGATVTLAPEEERLSKLMGALAFAHRPETSPYAALVDVRQLCEKLAALFAKECLVLLELPSRSALDLSIEAGSLALPRLSKLSGMLKLKYVELCKACDMLPIDLDLGGDFAYHSTFTCPVSKELASAANPPSMLQCGHVLGFGSMTKLARGTRAAHFKCPYCKEESVVTSAQVLAM